jgi:ribosomal-protein-alanine N-acetyltransferase
MIGVARKWQRQKIGARLLTTTIDLARNEKRSQLFLEVRDGNHAQDFYTSIGFHPVGRRENYYRGSDGFCPDAITMSFVL